MDKLKKISELKGYKFNIPNYQRGYRWTENEVKNLLEDINDFIGNKQSSFYCLQPIVVKKKDKVYNIIDGQQRLTTIFLILKFFKLEQFFFEITYQTRLKSKEFLTDIQSHLEEPPKNIDFYHFQKAYKTINDFFDNKNESDQENFQNTFLEQCEVLWYEVTSNNDNEVFIRLNIGKIPLLPTENIKALFLAKNDDINTDNLKERSETWYKAEKEARDNRDFKYSVLSNIDSKDIMIDESNKPIIKDDILRIEVYLKAIVKSSENLFDSFYNLYKKNKLTEKWDELEECINNLEGFASNKNQTKIDREIFHYIGFLISTNTSNKNTIYDIYQDWLGCNGKDKFRESLENKVKENVAESIKKIDDLLYGNKEDESEILKILLLFNLEYLISQEDSNEYFKFNRFKLEQWTLEHIYAQKSKSIKDAIKYNNISEIKEWLKEVAQYIEDENLKNNIQKCIEKQHIEEIKDSSLFNNIDDAFKNDESMHNISNLTLLDKGSNTKIGNKIFSQKRKEIKKLAEEDKLIPIATKKVFEKYWSKNTTENVWSKEDRKAYLEAIKEYLAKYIKE